MAWRRNPFDADVDKYGNMVQGLRLKSSAQPSPGLPQAYNEGIMAAGMKLDPGRIAAGRPTAPVPPQSMIDPGRLPSQAAVTPMRAPTNQELSVPQKGSLTSRPGFQLLTSLQNMPAGIDPRFIEAIKRMVEASRGKGGLVGY